MLAKFTNEVKRCFRLASSDASYSVKLPIAAFSRAANGYCRFDSAVFDYYRHRCEIQP